MSSYGGSPGIIYEARSALRLATVGPVNTAIGQGLVFDYFDEIRKLITPALKGILFIDPYLDADFVSRYLPHAQEGVVVRLLTGERLLSLVPAVAAFTQQHRSNIEVRSAQNFHNRYVLVDGTTCYQSGASFKDGGRNAPTTVTQITDAFVAVRDTYENLWASGDRKYKGEGYEPSRQLRSQSLARRGERISAAAFRRIRRAHRTAPFLRTPIDPGRIPGQRPAPHRRETSWPIIHPVVAASCRV